jgi:hypothetical protein
MVFQSQRRNAVPRTLLHLRMCGQTVWSSVLPFSAVDWSDEGNQLYQLRTLRTKPVAPTGNLKQFKRAIIGSRGGHTGTFRNSCAPWRNASCSISYPSVPLPVLVEYCNDSWDGHRLRLSYLFSLGKNRQFVAGQLTVLKYHSARRRFCPVLIRRKDFKFGHFEGSQSRHSLRLGRLV